MLILLISYNTHRRRVEIEGGTERIFILQILCTDVEQRRTRRILVLHALPCSIAQGLNERIGDGASAVDTGEIEVADVAMQLLLNEILDRRLSLLLPSARGEQQQGHTYYNINTFHLVGIFLRTSSRWSHTIWTVGMCKRSSGV